MKKKSLRSNIKRPSLKPSILFNKKEILKRLSSLGPAFLQTFTATLVFLIILVIFNYNLLDGLQDSIADTLQYKNSSDKEILILAIDDKSLQEYGRWPWDRDVQAQIQEKLNKFDIKVIGWDMTFFEPSEHDAELGQTFESDTPIVLASAINPSWQSGYVEPISELQTDNTSLGYINIRADEDGKLRSIPLFEYDRNQKCHKSFSLVMYEKYIGRSYSDPCEQGIKSIPLENKNELIINYAGPPGTIQSISVADFLEHDVLPDSMKDKIVIIGVTARYIQDYKLTPTSASFMSGAEIMGNIFYTLKNQKFIYREDPQLVILGMFLVSAFTVFIMRFKKSLFGSIIIFSAVNLYILFAIWQFSNNIIMDIAYLPITGVFAWTTQLIINFYMNIRSEEYLTGAFEHYVSKKVLTEIIKDREKLSLGGETKKMTVLFADIRKFSSFAEKVPAKKLVNLTNKYLTKMSDVILDKDGYIDKFIGDEIMAFWGAPLKDSQHAYHACVAAIEMMKALKKWKTQEKIDKKLFQTGIGINTGLMVVGNIGSEQRFSYTVLGDSVNLGSRLEGLTKLYKVPIIISESTYNQLKIGNKIYNPKHPIKNNIVLRELDIVKVKGRDKSVKLYEPVGIYKDVKNHLKRLKKFDTALLKYRTCRWKEANKIFHELKDTDPAVDVFISRIKGLLTKKFKSWDGIWEIQKK